jgi:hypothetical protein
MDAQEVALHDGEADVGPPPPPEGAEEEEADVGPLPPKPKKRKVLEFEQQYLQSLPLADMYEKSYMHRDTVVQVAVAHGPDFIITASVDGHIKFWKKQPQGIEFAKHFKAHLGPITGLAVSNDGSLCASISTDKSVKVCACYFMYMPCNIWRAGHLYWLVGWERGDIGSNPQGCRATAALPPCDMLPGL